MFTNWGVDILGSLLNSERIQWCVSSLADCNLSISQPSGRYGNHSVYSSSVIVLSLVVLCFVESCPIQLKNEPKTQSHPCVYFWNSFFFLYIFSFGSLSYKFWSLQLPQSLISVSSTRWVPMFYLSFPSPSGNLKSVSWILCPHPICFLSLRDHSLVLPVDHCLKTASSYIFSCLLIVYGEWSFQ